MDIVFNCPDCRQELEVDESGSGSDIECPECGATITIPEPTPFNIRALPTGGATANPGAAQAREKHLTVPVGKKTSAQIERPKATLETQARLLDKKLKVKCFRRGDFLSEPNPAFDAAVSEFLASLDENAIHSVSPIHYSHVDAASRQVLHDYGVMVVYRG